MTGRLDFQFEFDRPHPHGAERDPGVPFRILVVGDFGGHATRAPLARAVEALSPLQVDVDNFAARFRRLAPRASLALGAGESLDLSFEEIDDFHPDRLCARVGALRDLLALRAALSDPRTFAAAAERMAAPPGAALASGAPTGAGEDDLLERLLGRRPSHAAVAAPDKGLQEFLRSAVASHVVPNVGDEQRRLLDAVDETAGAALRGLLRQPAFQRLEALWRGTSRLVSEIGADDGVEIHVLDITRQELVEDVQRAGDDPRRLGLARALAAGGKRWSLFAFDLSFTPDPDDLSLLAALGAVAAQLGAPLLAAADPRLLACRSLVQSPDPSAWSLPDANLERNWASLRSSPLAGWIGLLLPRVLLRLPYGPKTDPIESFRFDEFGDAPRDPESYLWGNPALAAALLLGRSAATDPESSPADAELELDDFPLHAWRDADGEAACQPSAEIALTHRAAEAILNRGIVPVQSHRDQPVVRIVRLQSIADPPAPLHGL